jgi:hypothetical protein
MENNNKEYMDKVYLDFITKQLIDNLFDRLDTEPEIHIINPNVPIVYDMYLPPIVTPYTTW